MKLLLTFALATLTLFTFAQESEQIQKNFVRWFDAEPPMYMIQSWLVVKMDVTTSSQQAWGSDAFLLPT